MGWWTWVLPAANQMPVPMQAGQCCSEPVAQEKQKKTQNLSNLGFSTKFPKFHHSSTTEARALILFVG